ncbi:MAG: hypothetical protein A2600_00500 [Candidatus Lambdaproteobacteria bacterium RIFOXYD1_FULL_56_27]|uniref:Transposase n=1 Tax=Candidatus Lambdaproteobacteria bacterium RIFOXYD2_FULL_56_26 TaxID=1817773 RepID=A0A1F6GLU4_9PROT|nr:MAG: hypothetical protein A2557_10020 [Candidatus Lambdaproteobacteria bacterium RIFOXYD2_FULL_56_26]OGH01470.1 MAG: hypothetical protein A2426_08805 [Candidatus Lambdaproteobacteria bacterium RIFOXYC1_FULL_56_13]OGH07042.1 MAG: hypothetical protein A2600_00500 [Candidatus Lambdaproteobacteria bacterium RIFOXYD1_FULL_56_27]
MDTRIESRSYRLEFKLEAVRMATKSNQPKTQIAEVGDHLSFAWWCRAYVDLGQAAFKKDTGLTPEQQELKRLRLEIKPLREVVATATGNAACFSRP